jgi:UDP-N-acetylmuramoylalanine-D-glutamate ligase
VKGLVQPALASELRHPECKLGVRDDLRPVVREARSRKARAKRVLLSKAITSMELRERDAFGRVFRVQIEREPHDVGVELAP